MRGILKRWPPDDVYPDGQAQVSLRQAETAYRATLPGEPDKVSLARSEFDRLDKQKLRREMYREQRSLCIYCEREIAESYPTPRIDHWRPLSLDPGLALHWKNLYLSCTTPDTCDSAKGNRPFRGDPGDPHMPWPVNLRYEDVIGFTSGGEIYVRPGVAFTNLASADATRRALHVAIGSRHNSDRVQRGIVNLNHPALIASRKAAVDGERTRIEKKFKNKTATSDEREQRATQLLDKDQRPQFVSIRVAWLRKSLRRTP